MHPVVRIFNETSWSARRLRISCALLLAIGLATAAVLGGFARGLIPDPGPEPEVDTIQSLYVLFLYRTDPGYAAFHPVEPPPPEGWSRPEVFTVPSEQWLPGLEAEAGTDAPAPGVRFALGLWRLDQGKPGEAVRWLHAENELHPHPLVRRLEIDAAFRAGDDDHLESLRQDPAYADQVSDWLLVERGIRRGDWGKALRHLLPAMYRRLDPGSLMLSLFAGGVWWILLASLAPGLGIRRLLLMAAALALGWMSTWPTLLSSLWMDHRFGLEEGTDFLSTLLFQILSVGLREELCKLLLFVPLLPWVLKRGRDVDALLLGAMVGLGFAVEENINYFTTYIAQGTGVSRFVSANFLHLGLTGLTSLALVRAVRDPGRWLADSLQVLAMAIGLHALYNTLLSQPLPGFGEMSYLSGTALAGIAFLFFRELKSLAPPRARRVSRTAVFLWGFCVLFNLELLLAAVHLPFGLALNATGQAALGAILTGYIFLHLVDEPIGP